MKTTWVLLHVAGDDTFAKLLAGQSPNVREGYAEFFREAAEPIFFKPEAVHQTTFPKNLRDPLRQIRVVHENTTGSRVSSD